MKFGNSIAAAALITSVALTGSAFAQTPAPAKKPAAPAAAAAAKPAGAGDIAVPTEQLDLILKERLAQGHPLVEKFSLDGDGRSALERGEALLDAEGVAAGEIHADADGAAQCLPGRGVFFRNRKELGTDFPDQRANRPDWPLRWQSFLGGIGEYLLLDRSRQGNRRRFRNTNSAICRS